MDRVDGKILNLIQANFPIAERPYEAVAAKVGMSEAEVIERIEALQDRGVIRKIGPVFDSSRLGYKSTLVAMAVPAERLDEVAQLVSTYPEVTHNYGREDSYNLWFTIIAASQERLEGIIAEIKERTGVTAMHNLPATRLFKIKVEFELGD